VALIGADVTVNAVSGTLILFTLMMEAIVSLKHGFLQEPHSVTAQKTAFFIVTAVETSNPT
jgi:hypothetical protein